jgi:hypothetical protein
VQFKQFAAVSFSNGTKKMDNCTALLVRAEMLRHATALRGITEQPTLAEKDKANLRMLATRADDHAGDCDTWIELFARHRAEAPSLDRSPPFSPL